MKKCADRQTKKRAIVFVNGEFKLSPHVQHLIQPDSYIIAVDGGVRHAFDMGVIPHIIIGDLDSLTPEDLTQAKAANIPFLQFSPQKDETDLELALRHASEQGLTDIFLLGASGGRLDHSLANLFLLTHPAFTHLNIHILEGNQTAFLIRDTVSIQGNPGDLVSILPMNGDAVGVSNEGLKWPLHDEVLPSGSPRGMSNVLLGERATIHVRQGMLFCIITRQPTMS
jgi:thiamine pyrophosphokinase